MSRFEKSNDVSLITGKEVAYNVEDTKYEIPVISYTEKKDQTQALIYLNSIGYFPNHINRVNFKQACNLNDWEFLERLLEHKLNNPVTLIAPDYSITILTIQMRMESEIYMIDVMELLGLFPDEVVFFKKEGRLQFQVKIHNMIQNDRFMNRCKYE